MKKVLITGGTRFVGYWLQQTQPTDLRAKYIGRDEYETCTWMRFGYDYIIHAALTSPVLVLENAMYFGARVLYVSSGIVYQEQIQSDYRQVKLDGEKECFDSGLDCSIARLFTFYGDRLDSYKAWTQFTNAAKENKPIRIWGDGNTVRTYMSGEEMARRLWCILLHGERGKTYDVGDTEPITMLELAQKIIAEHNSKSEIITENKWEPMRLYVPENTEEMELLYNQCDRKEWENGIESTIKEI